MSNIAPVADDVHAKPRQRVGERGRFAPRPALPETLNRSAIDRTHLARYTFGNAAVEREILDLFCEQAETLLNQLKAAVTASDWAFATHSIKGCARAVGAWHVANCAEALERLGPEALGVERQFRELDQALVAAVSAAKA